MRRSLLRSLTLRVACPTLLLSLTCCDRPAPSTSRSSAEWQTFAGSWNATGTSVSIPLGPGRKASNITLRGTMLLSGEGRPGVGFRAELVGLVDTQTGLNARAVWTDERGDQIFSELKGEGTAEQNRIHGTFLGGTGRFADLSGTYDFSWQRVTELDDSVIQGRAVDLKGRARIGGPAAEAGQ